MLTHSTRPCMEASLSLQDDETCACMASPSVLQEEEALMQQRKERTSKVCVHDA